MFKLTKAGTLYIVTSIIFVIFQIFINQNKTLNFDNLINCQVKIKHNNKIRRSGKVTKSKMNQVYQHISMSIVVFDLVIINMLQTHLVDSISRTRIFI